MTCRLGSRITGMAALIVALVGELSGQRSPISVSRQLPTCGRDSLGLGRIRGQLVADSPGLDINRQGVIAVKACAVFSDASGAFMIRGLPAGAYQVLAGPGRHAILPGPSVQVTADSTSTMTIHLAPIDRVFECRQFPECAAILEAPASSLLAGLSDSDQVREASFRTMIAISDLPSIATGLLARLPGYHLATDRAITPASDGIVRAVRARVPNAEAYHPRNTPGAGGLTPDVERFELVRIQSVSIDGDHATVRFGGFESSSAVTLDRTPSGWRPVGFRVTTIQ
jgi:hypothetical protein